MKNICRHCSGPKETHTGPLPAPIARSQSGGGPYTRPYNRERSSATPIRKTLNLKGKPKRERLVQD